MTRTTLGIPTVCLPHPRRWQIPTPTLTIFYNNYKQMQAQMMGMQQPPMNVNPAMGQRGTWLQVHEYKEVESYPVPTDGTPTLFFDFDHGMFYSKKFANGQCCIQDFYFGPTNGSGGAATPEPSSIDQAPETAATLEPFMTAMLDKLEEMNKRLSVLGAKTANQSRLKGD